MNHRFMKLSIVQSRVLRKVLSPIVYQPYIVVISEEAEFDERWVTIHVTTNAFEQHANGFISGVIAIGEKFRERKNHWPLRKHVEAEFRSQPLQSPFDPLFGVGVERTRRTKPAEHLSEGAPTGERSKCVRRSFGCVPGTRKSHSLKQSNRRSELCHCFSRRGTQTPEFSETLPPHPAINRLPFPALLPFETGLIIEVVLGSVFRGRGERLESRMVLHQG